MSMQTEFVALVGPIVSGRVYPMGVTVPVAPYLTYTRIAAVEQSTLDANGGTGNPINTRIQVDVWAQSYGDAQAKAAAVKAALKTWSVENVLLNEQDIYDSETKLHRVMLDVSTWHL